MGSSMAIDAERDQVIVAVVAEFAPRSNVMDLEIFRTTTLLTAPSISDQNLPVKLNVCRTIHLLSRPSLSQAALSAQMSDFVSTRMKHDS